MKPALSYFICATPRSGSTLLCEALRNTGVAGAPDEYFGPMHVERWNKVWHTGDEKEYLQRVLATGATANGVFGCKLMGLYWDHFTAHLGKASQTEQADAAHLIAASFPNTRYIWITRRHKVRQAVSWLKFIQGAAWYWEEEQPQALEGLEFKPQVIDDFIVQTALGESAWQDYFQAAGVQPYFVVYEDFGQSYAQTVRGVLEHLGVPRPQDLGEGKRRLKKQADALSEDWVRQYQALKARQAD